MSAKIVNTTDRDAREQGYGILELKDNDGQGPRLASMSYLQPILRPLVETLCYAAHYCTNSSKEKTVLLMLRRLLIICTLIFISVTTSPTGNSVLNAHVLPSDMLAQQDLVPLTDIVAITANRQTTCALTVSGSAKCWGDIIGDDHLIGATIPIPEDVPGLGNGISAIAIGGDHACALPNDEEVKCWGSNRYGQLGIGSYDDLEIPLQNVEGLEAGIMAITAGSSHTCALLGTGGVKCWGHNYIGQLGTGSRGIESLDETTPVDVAGLESGVVAITAGSEHTCALLDTGGVKCWGRNLESQLGDAVFDDIAIAPVDIIGLENDAVAIKAGSLHTCALLDTGGVKCWGSNDDGQIGTGTVDPHRTGVPTPQGVIGLDSGIVEISASGTNNCALTQGGEVECWGNGSGTPSEIVGLESGITAITSGWFHSCALTSTGGVKCWGQNYVGQLGNGDIVQDGSGPFEPGDVLIESEEQQPTPLPDGMQILSNPSFDDNVEPWVWNGDCNFFAYESSAPAGPAQHGTHFLGTNRNDTTACISFYQDVMRYPLAGESYTFAIWSRMPAGGVPRQFDLALRAFNDNNQLQESEHLRFTVDSTEWQQFSVPITIDSAGYTKLRAEVHLVSEDNLGADYNFDNAGLFGPEAYTLSGRVETSDGQPIADATVSTEIGGVLRSATSGADGQWQLFYVSNGEHTISVNKDGYTFVDTTVAVSIQDGNTSAPTFVGSLPQPVVYSVSGVVQTSSGDPIPGAAVSIDGNGISQHTTSNAQGSYAFTGIPDGTYSVSVSKGNEYSFDPSRRTTNVSGSDTTVQPFIGTVQTTPNPEKLIISGYVKDGDTPIAQALVEAGGINVPAGSGELTDSEGYYEFSVPLAGDYRMSVTATGYRFTDAEIRIEGEVTKNFITAESAIEPLFELFGIEVTQSIQDLQNRIPLIEDKLTYIRVHVKSLVGTDVDKVSAILRISDESELGRIPMDITEPNNLGGSIIVKKKPTRRELNDGFYFNIPERWLEGRVRFEIVALVRDGEQFTPDCSEPSDNFDNAVESDCAVVVEFHKGTTPIVQFFDVRWSLFDPGSRVEPDEFDHMMDELLVRFPVAEFDASRKWMGLKGRFGGFPTVPETLYALRLRTILAPSDGPIIHGLIPVTTDQMLSLRKPIFGQAEIGGKVSVAYWPAASVVADERFMSQVAHEIAHNLGQLHIAGCSDDDEIQVSPNEDGSISPIFEGEEAIFGFHTSAVFSGRANDPDIVTAIKPPGAKDLLCSSLITWPSNHTYSELQKAISQRFPSANASKTDSPHPGSSLTAVIISGTIKPMIHEASIYSITIPDIQSINSSPISGKYRVVFENSIGQKIAEHKFDPSIVSDYGRSEVGFALNVPWHTQTQKIILYDGNVMLTSISGSQSPPSIELLKPIEQSPDEILLTWKASDADGDTLVYYIQFSADDGTNWDTIAADWTSTSITIPTNILGKTELGAFRVLASDGFHTTIAQLDQVISIDNSPPSVYIRAPYGTGIFVGSQLVTFSGVGRDVEDGTLAPTSLEWVSDLDGSLGKGDNFRIEASNLTEGTHNITLTVTDSQGDTASKSTSITISRSRPTFPPMLAVSSSILEFTTSTNGGVSEFEPLYVSNLGDGIISWEAETSKDWIVLMGSAESDLQVAVDTSGFEPGTYTGIVTITSGEEIDQQRTIDVIAYVLDTIDEPSTPSLTPRIFMPLIAGPRVASASDNNHSPDIGITEVLITGSDVKLCLQNFGTIASDDAFWVDLYIDPSPPPTGPNQTWNDGRSEYGAVWGVEHGLALGTPLCLTLGDAYYHADLSDLPQKFSEDMAIYVQVDSANVNSPHGNVLEFHELENRASNNIVGPIFPSSVQVENAEVSKIMQAESRYELPVR